MKFKGSSGKGRERGGGGKAMKTFVFVTIDVVN